MNTIHNVRNTRQVISNVHALVGGILLGIGVLVFAIYFFVDYSAAILALRITGGTIALSGVVELIICAFFRKAAKREQVKLDRLKADGLSFPAQITNIRRQLGVHYGRSVSAYAECTYQNREGKTCLVRSYNFLYRNDGEKLHAHVYVNPFDPTDYAVEVFMQQVETQGVYDYR